MSDDQLTRILFEYRPKIRGFFARRTSNDQDIEDLCSEVVVAMADGISRFGHRSSTSTWVYAICRNVYSHHVYYRTRDRKIAEEIIADPPVARPDTPSPVSRLLSRLSQDDQELYRLYYVEGYSVRELAVMLNGRRVRSSICSLSCARGFGNCWGDSTAVFTMGSVPQIKRGS